jgi:hypothetical protein
MDFAQVFAGFLQPVAIGSFTVFALLCAVGLRSSHRAQVPVSRKPSR